MYKADACSTDLQTRDFTIDAAIVEWLEAKRRASDSQKTYSSYGSTIESFRAFLRVWEYDLLSDPLDLLLSKVTS